MNIGITITVAFALLTGCAAIKYPNWQQVQVVDSVFKKPCERKMEESCSGGDNCAEWYKKRATIFGANTVVSTNRLLKGEYFYCGAGIPPYMIGPGAAWIVRNKFNPSATKLDYEKTIAECNYEAHKATIDTSKYQPSRVFIPTTSYSVNAAQLNAIHNDEIHQSYHELDLRVAANELEDECLSARGFVYTRSDNKQDLADLKSTCPDIDNLVIPCFVPGGMK